MNEEKATKRLIKAIENPYTTILGHITGRQFFPFSVIIEACLNKKPTAP
jgi:histidinol phosphatase-like PHP family hydrolase